MLADLRCPDIVSGADREKLVQWGVVERVGKDHVLAALQSKHLPRPETWRRLLKLWAYVAPDVTGWRMTANRSKLRILPAQGKNVLYSAGEVVRLGEKRLLQSEEDWEFLSAHLLVLNQNWTRFITEQRRSTEGAEDAELDQEVRAAQAVLKALGLEEVQRRQQGRRSGRCRIFQSGVRKPSPTASSLPKSPQSWAHQQASPSDLRRTIFG